MISQQKGFLFAIFASSILLSAIFIFSFVAFVFKLGFTKPDPLLANQNFSIFNNDLNSTRNIFSKNPGWTGYLNSNIIHQLLNDEQKYFRSFSHLLHDYHLTFSSFFGATSHRNLGFKRYNSSDSYNRNFAYVSDTPSSNQKLQIFQQFGANYELQVLYKVIIKVIINLVLPYYVLVGLLTYYYRPRLSFMILKLRDDIHQRQKAFRTHDLTQFIYQTGERIGYNLNSHIVRENVENKLKGSLLSKGFIDIFQTKLM